MILFCKSVQYYDARTARTEKPVRRYLPVIIFSIFFPVSPAAFACFPIAVITPSIFT